MRNLSRFIHSVIFCVRDWNCFNHNNLNHRWETLKNAVISVRGPLHLAWWGVFVVVLSTVRISWSQKRFSYEITIVINLDYFFYFFPPSSIAYKKTVQFPSTANVYLVQCWMHKSEFPLFWLDVNFYFTTTNFTF